MLRERKQNIAIATFLATVGIGSWVHWRVTDPSFDATAAQSEWPNVLAFSALVLGLGTCSYLLAHTLSNAKLVTRVANTLLIASTLGAATNIVEDGFGVEDAFVVFVATTGAQLLALVALATALVKHVQGVCRVLALVPLANALGIVLYVEAGGPILVGAWGTAAVVLLLAPDETPLPAPAE